MNQLKNLNKVLAQIAGDVADSSEVSESPRYNYVLKKLQADYQRKLLGYYEKFIPLTLKMHSDKLPRQILGSFFVEADLLKCYEFIITDPSIPDSEKDIVRYEVALAFLWMNKQEASISIPQSVDDFFSTKFCIINLSSNISVIYDNAATKTEEIKSLRPHISILTYRNDELIIHSEFSSEKALKFLSTI
jgi:hypothetical protein